MKKSLFLLSVMATALVVAGCSSTDTGTETTDTDTVETPEETGVAIPADFPTDIPVYENGTVLSATVEATGGARLSMESSDDMDTVYAWYSEQLLAAGWKNTVENKTDKNISSIFEMGNASLPVSIYPIGDMTRVNVSKTVY